MKTIEERTLKIVAEQFGVRDEDVTPEKKFIADLGADSLDAIECVMALEDEFNIEISDDDAEKWVTVQDALNYMAQQGLA